MMRDLRHAKRWELGLVVVGTGLGALGFAVSAATEFRFEGDTEHYVGLARSIARGEGLWLSTWRGTQFPPGFPFVLAPAAWFFDTPALLAVATLVIGWWRSVRDWGRFAALYALGYVGVLLLWVYEDGARFLVPLLPLLWLYLLVCAFAPAR